MSSIEWCERQEIRGRRGEERHGHHSPRAGRGAHPHRSRGVRGLAGAGAVWPTVLAAKEQRRAAPQDRGHGWPAQPATSYSFVLVDDGGRQVGEASIHAIDWRSRVAQVGICIWRPSDRGQGYGAAGSRAVIDWAVGHLGLHRLEAWILAGNGASLGLFRNLGFVEENRLTQRYLVGSQYMDMLVLARITGV